MLITLPSRVTIQTIRAINPSRSSYIPNNIKVFIDLKSNIIETSIYVKPRIVETFVDVKPNVEISVDVKPNVDYKREDC